MWTSWFPPAELRDPQALKARIEVALAQVAEREASRTSHHPGAVDPQTGEARGPQLSRVRPGEWEEGVSLSWLWGCPYRARCTRDRQGRRLQVRPEGPRLRAHRAQMRTPRLGP